MTTKFSEFVNGTTGRNTDTYVGLRAGVNTRSTLTTGLQDGSGNALVSWESAGALSANAVKFYSALTGAAPIIEGAGSDAVVGLIIRSTGSGNITLTSNAGNVLVSSTAALGLPVGTTVQRPAAFIGAARLNTTTGFVEVSIDGVSYVNLAVGGGGVASITGTANQIDVDATVPSIPVLSLSATLVAPGTVTVGNILLNANTISTTSGALTLTPFAGSVLNLDNANVTVDNGVLTVTGNIAVDNLDLNGNTLSTTSGAMLITPLAGQNVTLVTSGGGEAFVSAVPTQPLGIATKSYVDAQAAAREWKDSAVMASTAALTVTYDNGASGVGATLTNAGAQIALTIDGIAATAADRVLIKDQAAGAQNGIYTVTDIGSGATNWVLTRATDHDTPAEMSAGVAIAVDSGTVNAATLWLQTTSVVTVGTTAVTFTQFGSAGDVVGPASATDNAVARFNGTTGEIIQNSVVLIDDLGYVNGVTELDMIYTAVEAGDHGFEITTNAAGLGDVKAIDIIYATGALLATRDEEVILVGIDESAALGGSVAALEVLATAEGAATLYALETFVNINPIIQSSGTFGNADSILNIAVDVLAALSSGGAGNISVFVADNDTVTIGDAAKFEEIEIILATGASGSGIAPVFEYSTGVGTFATFTPADSTNGFRNSGAIAWLAGDIPGWLAGAGAEFLIRITRTRNSLTTTPIANIVQIAATTEYSWNDTGALAVKSVTVDADPTTALMLATKQYVDAAGGGLNFVNQTSNTVTLAADTMYLTNNGATLVTYSLPATATVGDIFEVVGFSSGGWTIAQGAGQVIHFGDIDTTTGAGGSLSSSDAGDHIRLMCCVTDDEFVAYNAQGNITYV